MSTFAYTRLELARAIRNRRFFIFSLVFPTLLYYLVAGPNRHAQSLGGSGISAPLYLMIGLAAFGTMNAMVGAGARIAAERSAGWTRQLRLTPLSPSAYFRAKLLTGYLTALCTIALLYLAGGTLGVHVAAGRWIAMTVLLLVGLLPFAALGILFGHLLTADSIGPVMGGTTAVLSLFGGVWFPVEHGVLHDIAVALPSHWLVEAARIGAGGGAWGAGGWAVVAAWTLGGSLLARRAYRRDTGRI